MVEKKNIIACLSAYNEESAIPKVIINTKKYVDKILVCDDGSEDMTADIAEQLGAQVIKHGRNLGKGACLRTLFAVSQGLNADIIVTLDADGQHNPHEIPNLLKPILENRADIVIGSRYLGSSNMPHYRKVGGRILNGITNFGRNLNIKDTQSGFRAYSSKAIKELSVTTNGFEVESQILISAVKKGLRMVEVPISLLYEGDTSTKHPITHANQVLGFLIRKILIAHPLIFLGIPGLGLTSFGLYIFFGILNTFFQVGYFSEPLALIAFTLFIVGIVMLLFSLTLLTINVTVREKREI